MTLPPIRRPNGKLYRPRKITAEFFVDSDYIEEGIVVFGTHDLGRARYLAWRLAGSIGLMAVDPELRWMRMVMRRGDPMFEEYPDTGRACVWFKGLVDVPCFSEHGYESEQAVAGRYASQCGQRPFTSDEAYEMSGNAASEPPVIRGGPGAYSNLPAIL